MGVSESKLRANHKYDEKTYDKTTIMFPKGIKDKIKASGNTVNGYVVKAVLEKLEKDGY